MEIGFENRDISIYREYCCMSARTQESVECVVPDTDADIEKIAVIQSSVLLKSKDLTPRGVLISGEITASVLYITEGQKDVSHVRIKKPFSLDYELEVPESESLAQIVLTIQGTDVRMINPRKLSVMFEIIGDLTCYRSEKLCVEAKLPEDTSGLHAQIEERSLMLPNAVCEKSVAVNEQFSFAPDDAPPTRLISEQAELLIADCQLIGSKMIIKGSAQITVCTLRDGLSEPVVSDFTTPFSQIVDVGVESMCFCTVKPEITGAYFDLIDTINGGKALDMEFHAVLQLVCSEQQSIRLVTDAYSNLMPAELICSEKEYELSTAVQKKRIQTEERIGLMESCSELLHTFASPARITQENGKLNVSVNLDFLYRNGENNLSSCRRTIAAAMETEGEMLRVLYVRPIQLTAKADGEYVECGVLLEIACVNAEKAELNSVVAVTLNEEQRYVQGAFPTMTLVRPDGESLWSLAKKYHSSEEKIRQLNENAENADRMLMIPKCI